MNPVRGAREPCNTVAVAVADHKVTRKSRRADGPLSRHRMGARRLGLLQRTSSNPLNNIWSRIA